MREAKNRVLIIGAGLIGLKCAEGIAHMTESLTVVDLSDHILSSILDSACAEIVQQKIESHGIQFLLGQSVQSFENNTALLSTGEPVSYTHLDVYQRQVDIFRHFPGVFQINGVLFHSYGQCAAGL